MLLRTGDRVPVLVVGDGAEDASTPLGRVLLDLGPHRVRGLDLRAAQESVLDGTPDDVLRWLVGQLGPELVLHVVEGSRRGLALPDGVAVLVAPPEAALAALRSVLADTTTRDAAHDDAGEVRAALAAALGSPLHVEARERSPRVSVVVPVHGQAAYLDATMRSVLDQTYDDYEVVVLDDGSRDDSLRVLQRYEGDPRVTVLTQPNIGGTGRLDLPFDRLTLAARGELVAWLGGDDLCLPDRLQAQVEAFDDDPGLDVCHTAAEAVDASGRPLGSVWQLERAYDDLSAAREMLVGNLVGHPSVMLRRSVHDRVGLWEQGLCCDYQMWLKAAGRLRFRYLPRRLVQYRLHGAGLSTSATGLPRAAREARRLRELAVRRGGLAAFFPDLEGADGARCWYEAGIALGNALVESDAALALQVYDLAAEAEPGWEVDHDRALASLVLGDRGAAQRWATCAAASPGAAPSRALARHLSSPTAAGLQVGLQAPSQHLDAALAAARRDSRAAVRRWDGTPVGVSRAYVAVDAADAGTVAQALAGWVSSTSAGTPLQWTVPDLGRGPDAVLADVVAAAGGLDLERAADLVLEHVDDLALLPPEVDRPTGGLSDPAVADELARWAVGAGRAERVLSGP